MSAVTLDPAPAPARQPPVASPLPTIGWAELLSTTAPCAPATAATAIQLARGVQRVVRCSRTRATTKLTSLPPASDSGSGLVHVSRSIPVSSSSTPALTTSRFLTQNSEQSRSQQSSHSCSQVTPRCCEFQMLTAFDDGSCMFASSDAPAAFRVSGSYLARDSVIITAAGGRRGVGQRHADARGAAVRRLHGPVRAAV